MSLYDDIPRAKEDWKTKSPFAMVEHWMDACHEVQVFSAEMVAKYYAVRASAWTGWVVATLLAICLAVKP